MSSFCFFHLSAAIFVHIKAYLESYDLSKSTRGNAERRERAVLKDMAYPEFRLINLNFG